MFDMFAVGFGEIMHPYILLLIVVGVVVGIIFGAIPGLTATMALAVCVPLTYTMSAIEGMAFLMALYIGGCSGGLISAILLKIPGTMGSIATTFDGAPMAARGEAGKALGVGIVASFIGGTVSFVALFFLAPPVADLAVTFGPAEYFAISIFALTLVASVSGDSMVKGLLAALFGMAIACVGMAPIDGTMRFTMGFEQLAGGFSLLPTLIGIFAVSELLMAAYNNIPKDKGETIDFKIKGFGFSMQEFWSQRTNFIRSSIIGTAIGILPGIGGSASNVLAYIAAKNSSKYPEKFGTGIIDGVVAAETANNASVGGALVPLLTLGIPGDTATAMLIGALMIQGLTPGPLMFTTNGNLIYGIFASLIVANFVMVIAEFGGMRIFVNILKVPREILMPIILVLCAVGTFGNNNRLFEVGAAFAFGLVGFLLTRYKYPLTPLILGFVLGPIAELNLRRALMMSQGDYSTFIARPISVVFLAAAAVSILFAVRKSLKTKKQ